MKDELASKQGDEFDKAFLSDMTMHHQSAVEMAQIALENAKHQEIKDMAQKMIDSQKEEIQQMQSWQQQWYGGE